MADREVRVEHRMNRRHGSDGREGRGHGAGLHGRVDPWLGLDEGRSVRHDPPSPWLGFPLLFSLFLCAFGWVSPFCSPFSLCIWLGFPLLFSLFLVHLVWIRSTSVAVRGAIIHAMEA